MLLLLGKRDTQIKTAETWRFRTMAKTSAEYAEILESILKLQILYIKECPDYEMSDYLKGQEIGLEIALLKIEQSKFLIED